MEKGIFMWKKVFLIFLFAALMVNRVSAQNMSFGPQLGYYQALDADLESHMGGVAWRLKFIPVFGIEASINYRQETYLNDAITVRSWPVMLTGMIYPFPIVYAAIGAGWYNLTFDYNQDKLPLLKDDTTQRYGWHFGSGIELPISLNFKFITDVRFVFLDYDFKDIQGTSDLNNDFYVATVGIMFCL